MPENTSGQTARSFAQWSGMEKPHFVYQMTDDRGRLLYVGCSRSPGGRLAAHAQKPWWRDVAAVTMSRYPDRRAALSAELELIREHMPPFNVLGVPWEELARRLEDA